MTSRNITFSRLLRLAVTGAVASSVALGGLAAGPVEPAEAAPARSAQSVPVMASRHTGSATALPPPAWLPWKPRVEPDAVSRSAPAVWSLAGALGHLDEWQQGLALPAATGGVPLSGESSRRSPRRGPVVNLLDWKWPIWPVELRRPFDPPRTRYGRGHRGVDLRASPGTPVFAAGPGVVVFSGPVASVGTVSVLHTPQLRTTYMPLASRVPLGTPVVAGTPIGVLSPGHCLPACLHWGARFGLRRYIDPTLLPEYAPELKPRASHHARR